MIEASLSVRADAEATGATVRFLGAFLRQHGVAGDDIARCLIVLEELVSNLVKYGYADEASRGTVTVTLRLADDRLRVEIVDDGREFDPFARPAPDLDAPLEERPVGGLGLHLVKGLMDETSYRRQDGRNITEIGRRVVRA
jgi:anti-sigma regulatory factor (Ser/Thr protein kinase)